MDVKAVDNVSSLNFGQRHHSKKVENKYQDYPQMDAPASKNSSNAMRNLMLGLMMLGATATTPMLTSCDKEDWIKAEAYADAHAWAWAAARTDTIHDQTIVHDTINHTDTVINTVIEPRTFKEYPFHIADSLIAQGLNIGIPLDGPRPKETNNNVIFLAAKAHNRYDNKFYEIKAQDHGTTGEVLTTITKIVDMYDSEHPTTQYMKTMVTTLPGRGIKLERWVSNSAEEPNAYTDWNYAGYEVRTNNRNGRTNSVKIYDKDNNFVGERNGEYLRGEEAGTFMFGSVIYDDDGTPYRDPETGEVEFTYYDFDKAKMWSQEVQFQQVPDGAPVYYYGTH